VKTTQFPGGGVYEVSRPISPNRLKALRLWLKSSRERRLKDIAEELGVSASQVRKWKSVDKWDDIPDSQPKRGAPYRNKNAVGNKGGAPKDNENAMKHGYYQKWLPTEEDWKEIYDATRAGMSPLDIVWEEILVMFTNFIRAQKIMYVKDKDDVTKVVKKEKHTSLGGDMPKDISEYEWEYQQAWDKQAKALTAQASASAALSRKIRQYEQMIRELPPEEVKEKHRLRATKLKADIDAVKAKAW